MLGELLKISAKRIRTVGSTYGSGAKGFGELIEAAAKETGSLGVPKPGAPLKLPHGGRTGAKSSSLPSTKVIVRNVGDFATSMGRRASGFFKKNRQPALAIAALGSIPIGLYAYKKLREK